MELDRTSPQAAFKNAVFQAAMEYYDRGWSIIPVSTTTKRAVNEWRNYQSRRASRDEIRSWFENGAPTSSGNRLEYFNLALVTGSISGVVVVDCDTPEAVEYAMDNGLCSPFSVKTTRGQHFYFKHPGQGMRFANKAGMQGREWPEVKGLDFRGDGGYIILPPSVSLNDDGSVKHIYEWLPNAFDWDQMPLWVQTKPVIVDVTKFSGEFSFDQLDLSTVRAQKMEDYMPVRDQAQALVDRIGGKLKDGDGRNHWLARFAGEKVKGGATGATLEKLCYDFQSEFFLDFLPEDEFQTVLRSIQETDRRNHPERYGQDGLPKTVTIPPVPTAPVPTAPAPTEVERVRPKVRPLFMRDLPKLRSFLGKKSYLIDPILTPRSILQIVGYNGHGKSLLTYWLAHALATGKSFGPYTVRRSARVLYCDFEMDSEVIADRWEQRAPMLGDAGDDLGVMAAYLPHDYEDAVDHQMLLNTEEGFQNLGVWIEDYRPEVVVIDTVRNAFHGMDENSPQDWARVNKVAKTARSVGCAVVMVHHRNKPGEMGLGREAGSTAQLTDLDTQLYLTQVYRLKDDAKANAGLDDSMTTVNDVRGKEWTAWGYLDQRMADMGPDFRLDTVVELRYGKRRFISDNQVTSFIGFGQDVVTGSPAIVSTLSPLQKALAMGGAGMSPTQIAKTLMIPARHIEGWLSEFAK